MPPQLNSVVEALRAGRVAEPVTVRTFLEWFDAYRRGWRVVQEIRQQLAAVNVITVPDFESRWIDSPIGFSFATNEPPDAHDLTGNQNMNVDKVVETSGIQDALLPNWISRDPTYRISKLEAATKGVEAVPPDSELARAITIMLARDFSQVAVMSNQRDVKGIISWQSIGSRLALGQNIAKAQDAMERVTVRFVQVPRYLRQSD